MAPAPAPAGSLAAKDAPAAAVPAPPAVSAPVAPDVPDVPDVQVTFQQPVSNSIVIVRVNSPGNDGPASQLNVDQLIPDVPDVPRVPVVPRVRPYVPAAGIRQAPRPAPEPRT